MPVYQLLLLDRNDRVRAAEFVECPDDSEALAAAQRLLMWHPGVEVWEGRRVVGRVGVPPPSPP